MVGRMTINDSGTIASAFSFSSIPDRLPLVVRKQLVLGILCTVFLASCGGDGPVACSENYWDGELSACLPEGWIVVGRSTLKQRGISVPEEVVVTFESRTPSSGQYPRITVTKEFLRKDWEASNYSAQNVRTIAVLPGYEQLDKRELTVDGETVELHIFVLQPDPASPKQRFAQISTVHGEMGYTFTGMTPLSVNDRVSAEMELILTSVGFEEQSE